MEVNGNTDCKGGLAVVMMSDSGHVVLPAGGAVSDAIQSLHAQVQAWEEECTNMGEIGRMRAFRQVRRKIEKLWPGVDWLGAQLDEARKI